MLVNVGMIGLGEMGMPMLERLRTAGHDVSFHARRPEVVARATGLGANAAADFADRDVVIICVYSDDQVREVGPEALATMRPGSTLVNHTTGSPTTVQLLTHTAELPRGPRARLRVERRTRRCTGWDAHAARRR